MWKFGLTVAAGVVVSLLSGQAQAVPSCTNTDIVTSGTVVQGSFLGVAGNCVQAGDKIFEHLMFVG